MKKKSRDIKLVKVEEFKAAKIVVEVEDELFEAMAQTGRKHIAKDKVACFSYALNMALLELCEEVK
jgi:hypothetical protein